MARMIEVRDLVKRYKKAERNAVDGVSFDVAHGEFFALLGPNGAGKTTTISILTTTLTPTSGTVVIDGCDAVRDAAGSITGVQVIGWDVTARKLADEELRKSRERFELAVQAGASSLQAVFLELTRR